MKNKVYKSGLSSRNKKRKDHKPISKKQVEKGNKKTRKWSKMAKNKIEYISNRILSGDKLKIARRRILEQFKNRRKIDPQQVEGKKI